MEDGAGGGADLLLLNGVKVAADIAGQVGDEIAKPSSLGCVAVDAQQ